MVRHSINFTHSLNAIKGCKDSVNPHQGGAPRHVESFFAKRSPLIPHALRFEDGPTHEELGLRWQYLSLSERYEELVWGNIPLCSPTEMARVIAAAHEASAAAHEASAAVRQQSLRRSPSVSPPLVTSPDSIIDQGSPLRMTRLLFPERSLPNSPSWMPEGQDSPCYSPDSPQSWARPISMRPPLPGCRRNRMRYINMPFYGPPGYGGSRF